MRKGNSREVPPPAYLVSDLRGSYYLWDGAGSTGQVVPAPSHGGREMAAAGGDKMVSEDASRRESGDTGTKVFKDNRNRGKRRSMGKRVGVGAEKRSSR